jgi:hypothetical protein
MREGGDDGRWQAPGRLPLLQKRALSYCFFVRLYRKAASHFSGRTLAGNIEFGPVKSAVGGNCGRDGITLDWQASANYVHASLAPFV